MKRTTYLLFASLLALSLFSCKKDDGPDPIEPTEEKEHYMPLKVGNTWTYNSASLGTYTYSITGKKTIDNFEYYAAFNTATSDTSYMNYDGNKLYSLMNYNGENVKLLFLDEDANVGDIWPAGTVSAVVPGSYTMTGIYTCEYIAHHDTYTVNNITYNDVIEINMTSTFTVELDPSLAAWLDQETIDYFTEMYQQSAEENAITQRTFYAKNIGFVYQYSDDQPGLGAELVNYTVL